MCFVFGVKYSEKMTNDHENIYEPSDIKIYEYLIGKAESVISYRISCWEGVIEIMMEWDI